MWNRWKQDGEMGGGQVVPVPCPLNFLPRAFWDGFAVWNQFEKSVFQVKILGKLEKLISLPPVTTYKEPISPHLCYL